MPNAPLVRQVPDFSAYPDLVVIYLGMRVNALYGLKTLFGLGDQIDKAGAVRPDGLLHYENNIIFRLFPLQVMMRWYWRDFDSLQAWSKSDPHRIWWTNFMKDAGGTGFWHETYFMRGGMEAIYDDMAAPVGFATFLPLQQPKGSIATRIHTRQGSEAV